MIVLKGDTPKFEISINFEGVDLPANDAKIENVLVTVFSKFDASVILGRYALKALEGHTLLTIKDNKAYLICDTKAAAVDQEYLIQIQTNINDAAYPNGKSIQSGTADLFKVKDRI